MSRLDGLAHEHLTRRHHRLHRPGWENPRRQQQAIPIPWGPPPLQRALPAPAARCLGEHCWPVLKSPFSTYFPNLVSFKAFLLDTDLKCFSCCWLYLKSLNDEVWGHNKNHHEEGNSTSFPLQQEGHYPARLRAGRVSRLLRVCGSFSSSCSSLCRCQCPTQLQEHLLLLPRGKGSWLNRLSA